VLERAPLRHWRYVGFIDPSGGSSDSMTMAVGHREADTAVLDLVREVRPPFSPESVVEDFSQTLAAYRVGRVHGDRYAGEWPREQFKKRGVDYLPSDKVNSDIYLAALPLLNSGKVQLLDNKRLVQQLHGLERRTARGGKDSIDHAPNGKDDVANCVCGALVLASHYTAPLSFHPPFVVSAPRNLPGSEAGSVGSYGSSMKPGGMSAGGDPVASGGFAHLTRPDPGSRWRW
jgi:hypothetical protein